MFMARARRGNSGFTLIELLIVVAVIGILAAIVIPVGLAQKAAANDAAVQSDLTTIAKTIEGLDTARSLTRAADGALFDAGARVTQVPTSPGVHWNVSGGADGFCVVGYHPAGGKYTRSSPLTYDSRDGGLGHDGQACSPGQVAAAFAVDMSAPGAEPNVIPDSTWTRTSIPVATTGNSGTVYPYFSARYRTVDVETPVSNRAVEVEWVSTANPQGIIFFQTTAAEHNRAVTVQAAGEKWSTSLWIKGPAGARVNFGLRLTVGGRAVITEQYSERTLTGDWQRLETTRVTEAFEVGSAPAVQVQGRLPLGSKVLVAGPQVEKSPVVTVFQPTR